MLLLLPLPGCWPLFWNVEPSCEEDSFTLDGALRLGEEELSPAVRGVSFEAAESRECVVALSTTVELGRGCTVYLESDGRGDRLEIYAADAWDLEGCGLDGGWSVADVGESHVLVDGDVEDTDSEYTVCFVGELSLVLDLTLSDGTTSQRLEGELTLDGGAVGSPISAQCE